MPSPSSSSLIASPCPSSLSLMANLSPIPKQQCNLSRSLSWSSGFQSLLTQQQPLRPLTTTSHQEYQAEQSVKTVSNLHYQVEEETSMNQRIAFLEGQVDMLKCMFEGNKNKNVECEVKVLADRFDDLKMVIQTNAEKIVGQAKALEDETRRTGRITDWIVGWEMKLQAEVGGLMVEKERVNRLAWEVESLRNTGAFYQGLNSLASLTYNMMTVLQSTNISKVGIVGGGLLTLIGICASVLIQISPMNSNLIPFALRCIRPGRGIIGLFVFLSAIGTLIAALVSKLAKSQGSWL